LLGQNELAAREVLSWIREQDGDLQGEHVRAVQILVQAVVVTRAVLEQQRRRPRLPGGMAAIEELAMLLRVLHVDLHRGGPAVGHGDQPRVQGFFS